MSEVKDNIKTDAPEVKKAAKAPKAEKPAEAKAEKAPKAAKPVEEKAQKAPKAEKPAEAKAEKAPKAAKPVASGKQIKVTLVRSTIGSLDKHQKTIQALGLKKIRSFRIHNDNEAIRGMIFAVKHLVKVEEV